MTKKELIKKIKDFHDDVIIINPNNEHKLLSLFGLIKNKQTIELLQEQINSLLQVSVKLTEEVVNNREQIKKIKEKL